MNFRPRKTSDLQAGDYLEWEIEDSRGNLVRGGTVVNLRGLNIELDNGDWLYWTKLKDQNPIATRETV